MFARALRAAGLPVGPGAALDADRAVEAARIGARADFYWVLHAVFVKRREHTLLFDQVFHAFWRRRAVIEKLIAQTVAGRPRRAEAPKPRAGALRAAEAMTPPRAEPAPRTAETERSARLAMSEREALRAKDFAQMSAGEIARREAADRGAPPAGRRDRDPALPVEPPGPRRSAPHLPPIPARRRGRHRSRLSGARRARPAARGARAIFQAPWPSTAVFFCISCTRSRRAPARPRLRVRDSPHRHHPRTPAPRSRRGAGPRRRAGAGLGRRHPHRRRPCAGSTACWSRRVLGQGAVVLLFTDGLERQVADALAVETDRLKRSCRRLVWLNPLLRFDAFEPRAAGVRAMLPHVHDFRAIHSLAAMEDLCRALGGAHAREDDPRGWLRAGLTPLRRTAPAPPAPRPWTTRPHRPP